MKRDRERGNGSASLEEYKAAIHQGVFTGGDRDAYAGLALRWDLVSRYNNEEAKQGGRVYKKEYSSVIPARFWPESRNTPEWIPAKGMPA